MGDFFETLSEYSKGLYGEEFLKLVDSTIAHDCVLTQWRLKICEQFEKHLDPVAQAMKQAHNKVWERLEMIREMILDII